MTQYRNEFMPDDGRNLPVVPFRFETPGALTRYKKECEAALHEYYQGFGGLPLPESIALSVLRANIKKRYEHQLNIAGMADHASYASHMADGLSDVHSKIILPGESMHDAVTQFISIDELPSVEVGFRLGVDKHTMPFDNRQAVLNAVVAQEMFGFDTVTVKPEESLKVTRIIKDSKTDQQFAVIKTKTRGIKIGSDEGIESVGRRSGTFPLSVLGNTAQKAAKILARVGDSSHMTADHREDVKEEFFDGMQRDIDLYVPAIERYYFTVNENEDTSTQ